MTTTIVYRCTPVDLKLRMCHVRHDSTMHVTRLIHVCDVTRLYTWQDSCTWRDFFEYVTRLFRVCDMTHSYMWQQGPCFCLSSLLMPFMCTYDMTWLLHVWHYSFMCDMALTCVAWLLLVQHSTVHTSNTTPYRQSTATLAPQHDLFTLTWLLHMSHNSSTCNIKLFTWAIGRPITNPQQHSPHNMSFPDVAWLLHMCHDSSTYATTSSYVTCVSIRHVAPVNESCHFFLILFTCIHVSCCMDERVMWRNRMSCHANERVTLHI